MISNEIVINKSKFIAYYFPVLCENDVKRNFALLEDEHKKATHICYAFSFDENGHREKCCDDGEPSGTAGAPILNVIKKQNLNNLMIAVVRYFGGIKLGAGGLIRAYTRSASELLKKVKS